MYGLTNSQFLLLSNHILVTLKVIINYMLFIAGGRFLHLLICVDQRYGIYWGHLPLVFGNVENHA